MTNAATQSNTPILDRLEPLPALRSPGQLRVTRTAVIGGVVLGFLLASADIRAYLGSVGEAIARGAGRIEDVGILRFAVVVSFALFAAVAIHEAAHAFAGRLAGFRIHSIRIWRFQLERRFRLSIYRGPTSGAGGWVVCAPETTEHLAVRAGVMLAAGPLSNLASSLIVYLFAPSALTFVVFGAVSLLLGVVNLLPLGTGPLFSDGYRIVMLLFDRARGERWLALLKLSKDVLDGVQPEFFSTEFLRVATAVKDESSDTVSAHTLAYSAAFRARRCDEAAQHLEACLRYSGRTSAALQHALMADAAAFHGRCRGDARLAEAWLENMPAKTQFEWHRWWAEAGVLHARGDREGTLAKLEAIARAVRDHPSPFQEFVLGGVDRWRSELR